MVKTLTIVIDSAANANTFSAFSGNDRSILYPARSGNVKQTILICMLPRLKLKFIEIMVPQGAFVGLSTCKILF